MFSISLLGRKQLDLEAMPHCISASDRYHQSSVRSSFLKQAIARKTAWQVSSASGLQIVAALDLVNAEVALIISNRVLSTTTDFEALNALLVQLIKVSADYLIETLNIQGDINYQVQFISLGFVQTPSTDNNQTSKQNPKQISFIHNIRSRWDHFHEQTQLGLKSLNITCSYACQHAFPIQLEALDLVDIGQDIYQRPQKLSSQAAPHWRRLISTATKDGVSLQLVSAFRSVEYQRQIIERKKNRGLSIDEILKTSAAPGFSEHHTGRAVDLNTEHCAVLEEEFATTQAYAWLKSNAHRFGFVESFPKSNAHQLCWEPWHWAWSSGLD